MTTILFPYVSNLILNDSDSYVSMFTIFDLYARHATSPKDYINKTLNDFNIDNDIKNNCIIKIFENIQYANKLLSTISEKFYEIPWSFVLFSGDRYEGGYPHTRFNSIFLPINICLYTNKNEQRNFIRTLLHEKIHLFQKLFPKDELMSSFMSSYEIVENKNSLYPPLVRANPDTDQYIYKNIHTNENLCFLYSSTQPSDIGDVIKLSKYEHPFEAMSYIFSEFLINNFEKLPSL